MAGLIRATKVNPIIEKYISKDADGDQLYEWSIMIFFKSGSLVKAVHEEIVQ